MKFVVALLFLGWTLCLTKAEEIKCGTKGQGNEKIVGGTNATKGSHPWQVSVKTKNSNFHFCGGSIIKPKWIVTAAHCFQDNPNPGDYKIVAGEYNISKTEGDEQEMDIDKIIRNKNYNESTDPKYDNDIALVKLKKDIKFDAKVRPVCLPSESFPAGTNCAVSGWGRLKEKKKNKPSETPEILQQAMVPLVSDADCKKGYKHLLKYLSSRMICAGKKEGGTNTCQGDSGGPLACKNKSGAWELVGVVSWAQGCARRERYTVFAKVEKFKDWIETNMKK